MRERHPILMSISNVVAYAEEAGNRKLLTLANIALEIGMKELALTGRPSEEPRSHVRPEKNLFCIPPDEAVDFRCE